MQKKLASIIFSTRLTATLFIVFAIAMAVGTLVDASSETSPTPYSRALIYNAYGDKNSVNYSKKKFDASFNLTEIL